MSRIPYSMEKVLIAAGFSYKGPWSEKRTEASGFYRRETDSVSIWIETKDANFTMRYLRANGDAESYEGGGADVLKLALDVESERMQQLATARQRLGGT